MRKRRIIKLHTQKEEEVLVNFEHISHITPTNSHHISLKFTHSIGKEQLGFYLVVSENLKDIETVLEDSSDLKPKNSSIIRLTTPKGKIVLVNIDNVVVCRKTINQHTSLYLNYTLGNPPKSAFVVVKEDFETILKMLAG